MFPGPTHRSLTCYTNRVIPVVNGSDYGQMVSVLVLSTFFLDSPNPES